MAKTKKRTNGNGKTTTAIYQEVTDRIVASLEEGHIPWQRPWRVEGGVHKNLHSKKAYRGINQFLLDLTAMEKGYTQPYWMTYRQIDAMGGQVRKDEESTIVVFWKLLPITTDERDDDGNKIVKKIPLLRYYRVFNVEQADGIEDKIPQPTEEREFTPIEQAQHVIDNMPNRPTISWGGDSAVYSPPKDAIRLPAKKQFDKPESYYHTAYHEMVHSTGHESRTGRVKDWGGFGSDPYAKEELVAEMGSAMLAGFAEIDIPSIQRNEKAYIKNWIQTFQSDPKFVVAAASKAQQAADYIIGDKS